MRTNLACPCTGRPVAVRLAWRPRTARPKDRDDQPQEQSIDALLDGVSVRRSAGVLQVELRAAYEEGDTKVLPQGSRKSRTRTKDFIPRFQDGAANYATTPGAIPYLIWLLTSDPIATRPTTSRARRPGQPGRRPHRERRLRGRAAAAGTQLARGGQDGR